MLRLVEPNTAEILPFKTTRTGSRQDPCPLAVLHAILETPLEEPAAKPVQLRLI